MLIFVCPKATFSLVRKGKGPQVERRREYKYLDLAYNFKDKKAEIFYITVDPREAEHKPYSHEGQEFNYILEGTLKVIVDKHELILNEGDSLYFDPRHPHAMYAMHNKPAKFLAVIIK